MGFGFRVWDSGFGPPRAFSGGAKGDIKGALKGLPKGLSRGFQDPPGAGFWIEGFRV